MTTVNRQIQLTSAVVFAIWNHWASDMLSSREVRSTAGHATPA